MLSNHTVTAVFDGRNHDDPVREGWAMLKCDYHSGLLPYSESVSSSRSLWVMYLIPNNRTEAKLVFLFLAVFSTFIVLRRSIHNSC